MSYGARAGVVEPLAKAGQLRVVVATMGLAAGINFSLRSVALAGESYRRDYQEQPLRADEILQMFGRAGRRGIDETGYVLITANQIRIREGYATHLSRSAMVDWSALLNLMSAAVERGRDPFTEAVQVQQRLFSSKPIVLGVEECLKNPVTPCGLKTDAERARHVRQRIRQMLNSRGEWEDYPLPAEKPLREIRLIVPDAANPHNPPQLRPALSEPAALTKVGYGNLVVLSDVDGERTYGRAMIVAERASGDRVILVKWARRLVNWHGRQANLELWQTQIAGLLEQQLAQQKTPVVRFELGDHKILALVSLAEIPLRVPVDRHGVGLWRPPEREVMPNDCAGCALVPVCRELSAATGVAMLWRRLGLVDPKGIPSRRGQIVSFFSQGDGLAIAAALEDTAYSLSELIYDVTNLDANFRFCGDENRWGGRLAMACQRLYGLQSVPGYLENGVPPKYGAGAEQVVAGVHKNPLSKGSWVSESLGVGDIDRVIIEWRSLLRQIAHAPELAWDRWREFQEMARAILRETESPTLTDLPPLDYSQTRRLDHRLIFKRF